MKNMFVKMMNTFVNLTTYSCRLGDAPIFHFDEVMFFSEPVPYLPSHLSSFDVCGSRELGDVRRT
jgi:hypothetical protein